MWWSWQLRLGRNQDCSGGSILFSPAQSDIFLLIIFSRSLAKQTSSYMGLYDVKSCLGFPGLGIIDIFADFHVSGIYPRFREAWNIFNIKSFILEELKESSLFESPSFPGAEFLLQLSMVKSYSFWVIFNVCCWLELLYFGKYLRWLLTPKVFERMDANFSEMAWFV